MYIYNETESYFLDKNQNVIDNFELGYKYSAEEINKVSHKPGYKYFLFHYKYT